MVMQSIQQQLHCLLTVTCCNMAIVHQCILTSTARWKIGCVHVNAMIRCSFVHNGYMPQSCCTPSYHCNLHFEGILYCAVNNVKQLQQQTYIDCNVLVSKLMLSHGCSQLMVAMQQCFYEHPNTMTCCFQTHYCASKCSYNLIRRLDLHVMFLNNRRLP